MVPEAFQDPPVHLISKILALQGGRLQPVFDGDYY